MNFNPLRLFGARPQKRALDESSELYRALAIYNQTASGFSVNDETALPTPRCPHTHGAAWPRVPIFSLAACRGLEREPQHLL